MTSKPPDPTVAREFVQFAVEAGVLRFGEFKTKAGRLSPYFFNSALFDDGAKLMRLAEFYARRLVASKLEFEMLFGPAYKGITLAAAVAIEYGRRGRALPFAYNRKEAKDHGEGGIVVGAPLRGRVVIVDDVITDGASKRESVELIRNEGAKPVGGAHRARPHGARRHRRQPFGAVGGDGFRARPRPARARDRDAGRPAGLPAMRMPTRPSPLTPQAVARYREKYGV